MSVQDIVAEANSSIGVDYCASHCDEICCKRGSMWIEDGYVPLVTRGHPELVAKSVNGFSLIANPNGCPSLDSANRCSVRQKVWPQYCKEFPLRFRESDDGRFLGVFNCTAVKAGLLDKYIARIEAEGVEVLR